MAAVRTVVVVGGGTAGCTVAGVLAQNKNFSVILLEFAHKCFFEYLTKVDSENISKIMFAR